MHPAQWNKGDSSLSQLTYRRFQSGIKCSRASCERSEEHWREQRPKNQEHQSEPERSAHLDRTRKNSHVTRERDEHMTWDSWHHTRIHESYVISLKSSHRNGFAFQVYKFLLMHWICRHIYQTYLWVTRVEHRAAAEPDTFLRGWWRQNQSEKEINSSQERCFVLR